MNQKSKREQNPKSAMKRASNSILQDRVLLALNEEAFESVTAIAARVDAHRASVSRAINALKAQDFVIKEGKRWALSEAGRDEVSALSERAKDRAVRATQQAAKALEPLGSRNKMSIPTAKMAMPSASQIAQQQKQLASAAAQIQKLPEIKSIVGAASASALSSSTVDMAIKSLDTVSSSLKAARLGSTSTSFGSIIDVDGIAAAYRSPIFGSSMDVAKIADAYRSPVLGPDMSAAFAVFQRPLGLEQQLIESYNTNLLGIDKLDAFSRSYDVASLSLLGSQKINLDLLTHASSLVGLTTMSDAMIEHVKGGLGGLLNQSDLIAHSTAINGSLGRMMGDMELMRSSALVGALTSIADLHMTQLEDVATGYGRYLDDFATKLPYWKDLNRHEQAVYDPWLPTRTTEMLVRRTRETIVPEDEAETRAPIVEVVIEYRESWHEVEELLARFAPRLAPKWRGAWKVLKAGDDDCYCQAAHSAREVLTQLLHIGAPNDAFTAEEKRNGYKGQPTRKMRFKKIMGPTGAVDWAESAARFIDETYDRLSAIAHSHEEDAGSPHTLALLESTQGLLRYVLTIILAR